MGDAPGRRAGAIRAPRLWRGAAGVEQGCAFLLDEEGGGAVGGVGARGRRLVGDCPSKWRGRWRARAAALAVVALAVVRYGGA